jgi:hypothetical protein
MVTKGVFSIQYSVWEKTPENRGYTGARPFWVTEVLKDGYPGIARLGG